MKKIMTLALLCILTCIVGISAKAAGLAGFTKTSVYTGNFKDVAAGSWYDAGVKSACEFSIMTGVGAMAFKPDDTVSVAESMTAAARIHSQYYGKTIPDSTGAWYQRYYQYALANGLLPPGSDLTSRINQPATRALIAYLFSKAIDSADLHAVNTASVIPDKESIPFGYAEAVGRMYASGVITGQEGNRFNPDGQATRAQMAVIVMRLLEPCERVSSDPNMDGCFVAQEGNVMNSVPIYDGEDGKRIAVCANGGGGSYLVYSENNRDDVYAYEAGVVFNPMMMGRYVYFLQGNYTGERTHVNDQFMKYDPRTHTATPLFTTTEIIDCVTQYHGMFYIAVTESDTLLHYYSRIYSVTEGGTIKELLMVDGITDKIAAFNNTLYFDSHSTIYGWKTDGSEEPKQLKNYVYEWTMAGNTIYYIGYGSHLCKFAADYPDMVKPLATVPDFSTPNCSIGYGNGAVYVSNEAGVLYKFSGAELKKVCQSSRFANHIGIFEDMFYYNANYNSIDYISRYGRIGSWTSASDTKSLFNWCFDKNMPANAAWLDKKAVTLAVGGTVQLKINNLFYSNFVWRSLDPSIATVGDFGLVTAVSNGTCLLVCQLSSSGQELVTTVTVSDKGDDTSGGDAPGGQPSHMEPVH